MESGKPVGGISGSLRALARKARGALGLGLFGGLASGLGGVVLSLVTSLGRLELLGEPGFWGYVVRNATTAGTWFFMAGATVSMTFATVLAVTSGGRSLRDLPLWRMALLGGAVAAVIPPAIVLAMGGWGALMASGAGLLSFSATFAGFGGLLTSGLVTVAKVADRRELEGGDEKRARLEPGPVDL